MRVRGKIGGMLATVVVTGSMVLGGAVTAQADEEDSPTTVAALASDDLKFRVYPADTPAVALSGYTGSGGAIEIPSTIMLEGVEHQVVGIDPAVFWSGTPVTKITLPEGLAFIGDDAFRGTLITEVTLPSTLTLIGKGAFSYSDITEVTIPDGVTVINDDAFSYTPLTSVTLPETLTSIGKWAFAGTPLTEVDIPDTVTSIGDSAFDGTSLTSLVLPPSLTEVTWAAFNDSDFTEVTIPASVTFIDSFGFGDNPALTRVNFAGPAPTVHSADANFPSFVGSPDLVLYFLAEYGEPATPGGFTASEWNGYTTAARYTVTFDTGDAPIKVIVDDGQTLSLPEEPSRSDARFLGWYLDEAATQPFDATTAITESLTVYAGWQQVQATLDDIVYRWDPDDVEAGAEVIGYEGDGGAIEIPDTITRDGVNYDVVAIGDHVFESSRISEVAFGENLQTIGPAAFALNQLTKLVFPDSVIEIASTAFAHNFDLASVTFGQKLQTIGDFAFRQGALAEVVIPDTVQTIGDYAFTTNEELVSLKLGAGVTSIGEWAFAHTGLENVTFPASIESIGPRAFGASTALRTVWFTGPAPAITEAGENGSFGEGDQLVITYPREFGAGAHPDGVMTLAASGFTTPLWMGYTARPDAALVVFDTAGGSAVDAVLVDYEGTATAPVTAPTRSGYTFTGWFTDAAATTPFPFADALIQDATVYAGWELLPVEQTPLPEEQTPLPEENDDLTAELADTGIASGPVLWGAGAGALALLIGLLLVGWRERHRMFPTSSL